MANKNKRNKAKEIKEEKDVKEAISKKSKKTPEALRLFYLQRAIPTIQGMTVSSLQSYFPSLEILFPSLKDQSSGSPTLAAKQLVLTIDVSGNTSLVEDLYNRSAPPTEVPTWLRMVHLVNPLDVMSGDFVIPTDGALPSWREAWQLALRKINDPYNEAYTDAVFACMASRLVETGRSPHFCRFYGTFNGRVPEYKFNITEDMSEIEDERWFREGLKTGAFRIVATDPFNPDVAEPVCEPWIMNLNHKAMFGQQTESVSGSEIEDIIDCDCENGDQGQGQGQGQGELEEADIPVSGTMEILRDPAPIVQIRPTPPLSLSHSSDSDNSDDEESEPDIDYHAILTNFPVQITVLERCHGTMDMLMMDENENENESENESESESDEKDKDKDKDKENRWTAWIFQVIAGLTVAQQSNDLHTNNIMWVATDEPYLYYHIVGGSGGDRYYRVPTYGRIMKIIDFGRATFRPPTASNENHTWFPDAFAKGEDAEGQYNCGPLFDQTNPKVAPNKSFDLCRLAVAMLDTLWISDSPPNREPQRILTREPGRIQHETVSPLWNLMWLWLTDDEGCNILRNPDDTERYPQFDLYCAIARDVHNAVPAQQLTLPLFDSAFHVPKKEVPTGVKVWDLVAITRV